MTTLTIACIVLVLINISFAYLAEKQRRQASDQAQFDQALARAGEHRKRPTTRAVRRLEARMERKLHRRLQSTRKGGSTEAIHRVASSTPALLAEQEQSQSDW
jgi:hypothetical protein